MLYTIRFLRTLCCMICMAFILVGVACMDTDAAPVQTPLDGEQASGWRVRLHEAAVVQGPNVLLGEIASPLGSMSPETWQKLAKTPLWPSPPDNGKPMQANRNRLTQALRQVLGSLADNCVVPASLAIQRGGAVWREEDLRTLVVKTLAGQRAAFPGETELQDFRLPAYIFVAHPHQRVELEPLTLNPGRLSLRFAIHEVDGRILRRVTGSVFMDVWVQVPAAGVPLNKGDALVPENITFVRVNLAYLRDAPWDGKGGPWQVQRSIGAGQTIYQGDLMVQAVVKKGALVTLIYAQGNVRLTVPAEALSDGGSGDTISVRNLQSKKQVFAIVRDSGTVETR